MATIPLSRGLVAIVDDADHDAVSAQGSWYADPSRGTFYARRNVWLDGRRCVGVKMHRFLTGWDLVDHINGDGLDNRRVNLRAATPRENARNRRVRSDSLSGFKGVRRLSSGTWIARIEVGGRRVSLGSFDTAESAALAYDAAAVEHFGEFARVNFPDHHPESF